MKSILIAVLMGGAVLLGISSCATVSMEPLAAGELRLLRMKVPEKADIKVNSPFVVNVSFDADGEPEIRTACFDFSGDGPYCFKVIDVNYGAPGTTKIQIRAKKHGSYFLQGYIVYVRDGRIQTTNVVGTHVRVTP